MTQVVIVPGVPALLPQYAGLVDPVAELREACHAAVTGLVRRSPARIYVLADTALARRVAAHLLEAAGFWGVIATEYAAGDALLVVANGTARRSEKAPGHLDERSADFDDVLAKALESGDGTALTRLDRALGAELLAEGLLGLEVLGWLVPRAAESEVHYAGDPYGVAYWVVSWS